MSHEKDLSTSQQRAAIRAKTQELRTTFNTLHARYRSRNREHIPLFEHPFEYLRRAGGAEDIQTVITTALNDPERYIIQIIGPLRTGKTKTAVKIAKELEEKNTDFTMVTFEDAQAACKLITENGQPLIEPSHISGSYTWEDYHVASSLYTNALLLARKQHDIVLAETVSITHIPNHEGNFVGMDRGTSSIRKLIKEGIPLSVIALSAGHKQMVAGMRDRAIQETTDRPGGTKRGTRTGDRDITTALTSRFPNYPPWTAWDLRARTLEDEVYPWLINDYFGIQDPSRYIICESVRKDSNLVPLEEIKSDRAVMLSNSFIQRLARERKLDELVS